MMDIHWTSFWIGVLSVYVATVPLAIGLVCPLLKGVPESGTEEEVCARAFSTEATNPDPDSFGVG